MSNVIAFPRPAAAKDKAPTTKSQAQTLYLHIKRSTLIVHLSGAPAVAAAGRATTR